jgi:uracil-DNA glycosylase
MLQEMGVTVWAPAEAPQHVPAEAATKVAPAAPMPMATPPAPSGSGVAQARTAPSPVLEPVAAAATASQGAAATAAALRLHAAQPLYPQADPAQTPAELGAGWLVVAESATPAEPLLGDAGKLLDNMLRAMQLHRHPRVFIAALERVAPGGPGTDAMAESVADTVARLQPAMVLVLGHVAARAALGRTEPLGRLRAELHQLAGCPAVVTYDPAFLLRSQDHKAAAWADLCRALAAVRARSAG